VNIPSLDFRLLDKVKGCGIEGAAAFTISFLLYSPHSRPEDFVQRLHLLELICQLIRQFIR
jgi:hypothetical protein